MANPITFFYLGTMPRNKANLIGILLTARRTARQLDPSINKVLVKGSAHESRIRTPTGEVIKDPLHYPFQFKNHTIVQKRTHWKAHAYVNLDESTGKPPNWYNTSVDPVREADNETLAEAPDEYYNHQKQRVWDIWDPVLNGMKEFSEKFLEGWFIGDNFVVSTVKEGSKTLQGARDEVEQDQVESQMATELMLSQEVAERQKD
ncbi:MAG: hypothetical protein Q9211_001713 [Gyalolechia sp. 1 TL-2023]